MVVDRGDGIRIHKSIIFPVLLYGCETWSWFEKRVLRRRAGPRER
jgi:hypothetical protein